MRSARTHLAAFAVDYGRVDSSGELLDAEDTSGWPVNRRRCRASGGAQSTRDPRYDVHRLAGDEGSANQFGVRQPGAPSEQFQAGELHARHRTRFHRPSNRPGLGVAPWLHAGDGQAVHDRLVAAGVPIVTPPFDRPFGRTFTFTDADGYAVTIHDKQ